ncbi:MAG: ATP-binding protein [Caldisphaeraceae archaeon]|nr:ATP-binding protein [Caldisphaeraceae archaeon]
MECGDRFVGYIIGESSPRRSLIIFSHDSGIRISAGMYLAVETVDGCILGIVEHLSSGSRLLPDTITDSESVGSVVVSLTEDVLLRESYLKGTVRWLSYLSSLKKGIVESPKVPPMPGAKVYAAKREDLDNVFAPNEDAWISIGRLSTMDVEYKININKVQRHLAILAVTGGGKSNTICVIAKKVIRELNGTIVIFDMHGEYGDLNLGNKAYVTKPYINPIAMDLSELKQLAKLPPSATNQERVLRHAWDLLREKLNKNLEVENFMAELRAIVEEMREGGKAERKKAVDGVLNRLDDIIDYYGDILNPKKAPLILENIIQPGKLTVFDLSEVDIDGADAIVSHYLRRILQERKKWKRGKEKGYPVPIFVVIEEAHILVPGQEKTLSHYWASRIAREGRKFGVGLILVSQRPKNLDQDVLSQMNNKIILRMVEPQDISYVQSASEELSSDLANLLPSLNPGEAIVIGSIAKLPALVKIEECRDKRLGHDIDIVKEWSESSAEINEEEVESYF